MTRIDFYVLKSNSSAAKHTFVCRLIDKAVAQGSTLLVATESAEHSAELDDKLWSFKPEAYIPHDIIQSDGTLREDTLSDIDQNNSEQLPVRIYHEQDDIHYHNVLVNLRPSAPKEFSRFERVIEVVNQESESLKASRKNYAYYKERGYPIHTHKLQL